MKRCSMESERGPLATERPGEFRPLTLWIHTLDFDEEELLLSPQLFDELRLQPGDFVELHPLLPDAMTSSKPRSPLDQRASCCFSEEQDESETDKARLAMLTEHVVLRVAAPAKAASTGAMQVSVLKAVAEVFQLSNRQSVELRPLSREAAALDWIEIVFKDQQAHGLMHSLTSYSFSPRGPVGSSLDFWLDFGVHDRLLTGLHRRRLTYAAWFARLVAAATCAYCPKSSARCTDEMRLKLDL